MASRKYRFRVVYRKGAGWETQGRYTLQGIVEFIGLEWQWTSRKCPILRLEAIIE